MTSEQQVDQAIERIRRGCGAVLYEQLGKISIGIGLAVLGAVEDELRDRRQELIEVLEEKKG
jgi:malate/lactate dehydrogenase